MAVTFLKKAKTLTPQLTAKLLLHRYLSGYDPARTMKILHASELTKSSDDNKFCPRSYALRDLTGIKPQDKWLSASERMTFQIGRDQEANLVRWFGEMGRAVCDWRCRHCGKTHFFCLKPAQCNECGCKQFDGHELRFTSTINGASCGIDMLLGLNDDKLIVYEIKTIDKDKFAALQAPLAEHRWRTNFYLRILAESGDPKTDKINTHLARILYISKGGFGCVDDSLSLFGLSDKFSPFKEFEIKRNDAETESLAELALSVKQFREDDKPIPKRICTSRHDKRAKYCPWTTACFKDYDNE